MTEQDGILLRALDGSNPLAFLAALGTFRLLTLEKPDSKIQMCWERADGAWRPRVQGVEADEEGFCQTLLQCPHWAPAEEFVKYLGKNITVPKDKFSKFVNENAATAQKNRAAADFAASFGCEICEQEGKDRIEYTSFCFITGSGHQDFLGTISALAGSITAAHLQDALFGEWKTEKGLSMRWDPRTLPSTHCNGTIPAQREQRRSGERTALHRKRCPSFPLLLFAMVCEQPALRGEKARMNLLGLFGRTFSESTLRVLCLHS